MDVPLGELEVLTRNARQLATRLLTKAKRQRKYRRPGNLTNQEIQLLQAVVNLERAGKALQELVKEGVKCRS